MAARTGYPESALYFPAKTYKVEIMNHEINAEEAGELLADYLRATRDFTSRARNKVKMFLDDTDWGNQFDDYVEQLAETKFWRKLYFEGAKAIRAEIAELDIS